MAKAFLFNTSGIPINISINNGPFIEIPAANTSNWLPSLPNKPITVVANMTPSPGQICLGSNVISYYPAIESPAESSTFTLSVPTNTPIESLQLYLFRADQESFAWVANINGAYCAEGSGR